MRKSILSFITMLTITTMAAGSPIVNTIDQLADRLVSVGRYDASAVYNVLLPSATDEVVYQINLQSEAAAADSLAPCDYLIEWTLQTPSGEVDGFSAYSAGSHYRYRDHRLQEYHFDWDSIPFLVGQGGVQRNAQFADILPQFIGVALRQMAADSTYTCRLRPDARYNGREAVTVEATQERRGYTSREMTYTFDAATLLPLRIDIEYNPGAVSEQTVSVTYGPATAIAATDFGEAALIERHPDEFGRYRQSNFRIETLPGTPLPSFSLPTLTAERYSRQRGDTFVAPTLVVMLEPTVASSVSVVEAVRRGVDMLPFNADIIWAFMGSDTDTIERLVGEARVGETTLISAKALARDTGANDFPVIIFAGRDGVVKEVQLGDNKSLTEIVMQKSISSNHAD